MGLELNGYPMVNCPRCGMPNPDHESACLACQVALDGQRFAQALDRAQAQEEPPTPAPVAPETTPGLGAAPTALGGTLEGSAEVERFMRDAKRRARRRRHVYAVASALAALVAAGYFYISSKQEQHRREAADFLTAFTAVDNGPIATFWRCAVHAKHRDVHRATDNIVVTNGLTKAFKALPVQHPIDLKTKCLPYLDQALTKLKAISAPEAFKQPLARFIESIKQIEQSFGPYIDKLEKAADAASHEQVVLAAAQAFHDPGPSNREQAIGYVELLRCAVPQLPSMVRAVRRPPDTQRLVEHIFSACKADTSFASRVLERCFDKLTSTTKGGKLYRLMLRRMSGDDRDVSALRDCFRRAANDVFEHELAAVGQAWVGYRNAGAGVMKPLSLYKNEAAESSEGAAQGAP